MPGGTDQNQALLDQRLDDVPRRQLEGAQHLGGADPHPAAQYRRQLVEVRARGVQFVEYPPGPRPEQLAGMGEAPLTDDGMEVDQLA